MKPCRRGHTSGRHNDGHCKECWKVAQKRYYDKEPEEVKVQRRLQTRTWEANNPERARALKRHCDILRKSAGRFPLNSEQRNKIIQFYKNCPAGHEVDHIYPLRGRNSCGLHVPWNLQYLTGEANRKKGNKLP